MGCGSQRVDRNRQKGRFGRAKDLDKRRRINERKGMDNAPLVRVLHYHFRSYEFYSQEFSVCNTP